MTFRGQKVTFAYGSHPITRHLLNRSRRAWTSFDSAYAISSAVSKLVTLGDLCDLQGSKGHFCLWQPSYNSASTGPIETSLTSFDSAYAISSAVSKMVSLGDLCDLQGSKGHFCLWQPSYNSASTEPIETSLASFDSAYTISSAVSIQHMRFHQPFRSW